MLWQYKMYVFVMPIKLSEIELKRERERERERERREREERESERERERERWEFGVSVWMYLIDGFGKRHEGNLSDDNNNNNLLHLYSTFLGTQSALHTRGNLLNHHQCAASTWMMRRQP